MQNKKCCSFSLQVSSFTRFVLPLFSHHSFCYSCGFHLFTRPRKELDTHKGGEMELLREALSSEIHFLKSVSVCSEQSFSYCMNKNQPNQTYRHDYLHVRPSTEKNCNSQIEQKGAAHCYSSSKCQHGKRKFRARSYSFSSVGSLQAVILSLSFLVFFLFAICRSWTAAREVSGIRFNTMTAREKVSLLHRSSLLLR